MYKFINLIERDYRDDNVELTFHVKRDILSATRKLYDGNSQFYATRVRGIPTFENPLYLSRIK